MIKGHSFTEGTSPVYRCFLYLAGVKPQDFPEPYLEAPQAEQALTPPDDIMDPPIFPDKERSPQPIGDGVEDLDVEAGEMDVGSEPMTLDQFQGNRGLTTRTKKGRLG